MAGRSHGICEDLWTTQLLGYDDNNADRDTLAQWVHEQFRTNLPYDQIVEEWLTSTGESAFGRPVNFLLRYPDEPVVKVSRAFLGVRLDCARCHDHPFDWWWGNLRASCRWDKCRSSRVFGRGRTREECVGEDFRSLRYTKSWRLKTFMSFPAIPANVEDWRC
jgi:hypothetical protein